MFLVQSLDDKHIDILNLELPVLCHILSLSFQNWLRCLNSGNLTYSI